MSEQAQRTVALLVVLATGGLGWRAACDPARPSSAPAPCHRPVAVVGEAAAPGVVCLGPAATAVDALRAAGARCLPTALPSRLAPGDRLTVLRPAGPRPAGDRQGGPPECLVERDRLPALTLRTLRVPIDLNRADEAELRALPGIGPALAKRIVESRRAQGPFGGVDDLRRVRGIGPHTLARLRDRLEVSP